MATSSASFVARSDLLGRLNAIRQEHSRHMRRESPTPEECQASDGEGLCERYAESDACSYSRAELRPALANAKKIARSGIGVKVTLRGCPKRLWISALVWFWSKRLSTNLTTAADALTCIQLSGKLFGKTEAGCSSVNSTSRNRWESAAISSDNCSRPPSK